MLHPKNDDHFNINVAYCINSLVCTVLFIAARCNLKYDLLALIAFTLLILRFIVRNFDYEHSFEDNTQVWIEGVVANNMSILFDTIMLMTHFKYRKLRNIVGILILILHYLSIYVVVKTMLPEYEFRTFLANFGAAVVVWTILLWNQQVF